jgi:uncharacterized BrkB/YihY/UPF0761 family membrane protein
MSDETDNTVTTTDDGDKLMTLNDWQQRWSTRRRLSIAAFVAILVVTLLLFYTVPIEKVDKLDDVVIWFYGTMATIILGYMGTTVSAHIFDRRTRG